MTCVSVRPGERARRRAMLTAVVAALSLATASAQTASLDEMVGTERRFAARALAVGWKQAFLEYFADGAPAFDGDRVVSAQELFRHRPDPLPLA